MSFLIGIVLIGCMRDEPLKETYTFERMWPTLKQPWYLQNPSGLAINSEGSVYVVDTNNHRIQKFTSEGTFITKWGSNGSGDGEFSFPLGIAVDAEGNVYVSDTTDPPTRNNRIQKFSSDGTFIKKWGSDGTGNGEFKNPHEITSPDFLNVLFSIATFN